jgi:NADH-quinone oxidoreductase subunit L
VIHAVHTNEMTEMGGLRKKMPLTAFTMLVGCLAISGISIPFLIGFSGYYSKDMILEQAFAFMREPGNGSFLGSLFFAAGAGGAAITAFYMFRLWFMTFAGRPRNMSRFEHAHESPKVMVVPLIILAVFATCAAWKLPWGAPSLQGLLEQACPAGTGSGTTGRLLSLTWPDQHAVHEPGNFRSIVVPVTLVATATAWAGIALAMAMYLFRTVNPHEVRQQFSSIYRFLWHKWWFDELYQRLFVRPTHVLAGLFARVDRRVIDGFVDALARFTERFARVWERVSDRMIVDRLLDALARRTYRTGVLLRSLQTGMLRQYVMYLIVGVIALFIFISLFWIPASGN